MASSSTPQVYQVDISLRYIDAFSREQLRSAVVGDAIGPDGRWTLPPAAWYRDPWGAAPLRWWDGRSWTGFTSTGPGAAGMPAETGVLPAHSRTNGPSLGDSPLDGRSTKDRGRVGGTASGSRAAGDATSADCRAPDRARDLPAALCAEPALAVLVQSAVHRGTPGRFPLPIPGHVGLSFLFDVVLALEPLAAGALVIYLLSISGEGGGRAIGLDRSHPRQDLALLLPVFVLCFLIPEIGVSLLLHASHVRAIAPSAQHLPRYFSVAGIATAVSAGVVEEIVVLGFLVRRLEQLGLRAGAVVTIAVLVRISYHLYYGWGVLPILAWAVASVLVYRRYRRLAPFIAVHVLWDVGLILVPLLGAGPLAAEVLVLAPSTFVFWLMWRDRLPRHSDAPRSGSGLPAG